MVVSLSTSSRHNHVPFKYLISCKLKDTSHFIHVIINSSSLSFLSFITFNLFRLFMREAQTRFSSPTRNPNKHTRYQNYRQTATFTTTRTDSPFSCRHRRYIIVNSRSDQLVNHPYPGTTNYTREERESCARAH